MLLSGIIIILILGVELLDLIYKIDMDFLKKLFGLNKKCCDDDKNCNCEDKVNPPVQSEPQAPVSEQAPAQEGNPQA